MEYGSHVDDALMNGMRTDVSFTLFLSDLDTYDGGALVIETPAGEDDIRLPAGSMVAYRLDHAPPRRAGDARRAARGRRLGAKLRPRPGAGASSCSTSTPRARRSSSATARPRSSISSRSRRANLLRMWAED